MNKIIIVSIMLASLPTFAKNDSCRSKALKVSEAIDEVYQAKEAKSKKVSVSYQGSTNTSFYWNVSILASTDNFNNVDTTMYFIEMQRESCEIIYLSQVAE